MVNAQIVMIIVILVLIKVLNVHLVGKQIIYYIKTSVFLNVQQEYFKLDFLVLHVHHLVKHVILVQMYALLVLLIIIIKRHHKVV